ncbi:MAG TPA: hypothetical protein VFG54_11990 [Prolixibacteraceae bacterium]|nr:hypothetical protein [Prolixibacteraceae bacterium]
MQKRLLTFGYKIYEIDGFPDMPFSNYTLSYSTANRWKKKLLNIEEMINSGELQCILIVVTKSFIYNLNNLKNEDYVDLLNICKKTNCIVAIQEYLIQKEPLYFDNYLNKYVSEEEIGELIKELKEKGNDHYLRNKLLEERNVSYITEDEGGNPILKDSFDWNALINRYNEKLDLLKGTKEILPKAKEVIGQLESIFEKTITFKLLSQLTKHLKEELTEQFSNEILNIYIPKQYGYTVEFQDFINLFERYLKSVENLNFQIVINETFDGINYKFISIEKVENIDDLPNKFQRFSYFVDLCENEPSQAMQLLDNKNISKENAINIIQRLSKKYKRLLLDIQQQKERLELSYSQELQNELFECQYSDTPFCLVEQNFSSKTFENVYAPNEEELQIIKIVEKHAPEIGINQIQSNLGIVKDPQISSKDKEKSSYKLKKTLLKIMKKGLEHAEQIAIESAVSYINSKLG